MKFECDVERKLREEGHFVSPTILQTMQIDDYVAIVTEKESGKNHLAIKKRVHKKIWKELCKMDDRFASGDEYPTKLQQSQAHFRVFSKELERLTINLSEVLESIEIRIKEIQGLYEKQG